MKNVLLIMPDFFEYKELVISALMKKYNVITVDEFKKSNFIRVTKKITNHYKKKLECYNDYLEEKMTESNYDVLFVIKGDNLNLKVLNDFKINNPNAKTILYQWDSLLNYDYSHLLSFFDSTFTFDADDALSLSINYLPLFFDEERKIQDKVDKKIDMLFVGSLHSHRYELCQLLKTKYPDYNFVFLLYISLFDYIKNAVFNFTFIPFKLIRFTPIKKDEMNNLISQSKAILDIESSNQKGITIRTFETLSLNVKLITTNKNILNIKGVSHSRFVVIDPLNPILDKSDFEGLPDGIVDNLSHYSIDNWLINIGF
ncbi:hypothetical protein VXS06_08825 [Photobacterium toruni]|uniref:Uncharacterized protein n=1 Tax=Photobacterium toruni TaxID=1935446 RepID=A0ABU6L5M2_9GAMM|nr:hypothetical protein [Photobacterium toruni]